MGSLILNVDDFEPQRHVRSSLLRAAGYEVIEAATGEQALTLTRDRHPALILLDVHLPDISGLEVCRRVKADPATAPIVVLQISATFREAGARTEALNNGADSYVAEPVESDVLLAEVRALLRLASAERRARQASEAVRESRERLESFFNASGVLMAVVELEENDIVFLEPNAELASFFGLAVPDLVGKRGRDLDLPDVVISKYVEFLRGAAAAGRPVSREHGLTLGHRSGWYHSTVSPIPRSGSEPARFAVTIVDTTERKQLAERIARERAQLEAVYQAMHDGVTVFNTAGDVVMVNEAVARFCGASSADSLEELARCWARFELLDLEGAPLSRERWPRFRVLKGEVLKDLALRIRRMDTKQEWIFSYSGRPILDEQGQQSLALVVSRDITAQKSAENDLRRSEAVAREAREQAEAREREIESIYDSAPIGLCILDSAGRYLRINKRLAEINGMPPEAHLGRSFREVVPLIAEPVDRLLRQVITTGVPALGVEISGVVPGQPSLARTWIENWFPVRDAAGAVVAVNVAVQEITERKQMEEELRRANEAKDAFLATLSHELRTPLSAISGWADLLRRGVLDEQMARQGLDAIARNADAQKQLISDILDVSRLVAGKLRLDLREVDLVAVVHLAVASARPVLDAKQIALDLLVETEHAPVRGDADRLQQVVWNLLSNAAKFTSEGGRVSVNVRRTQRRVELTVSDTGIGIPRHFLPHVFDRFAQADSGSSRRHTGLGLGLSIVRQLVELHGGVVSAESDGEGRGARFAIGLPADNLGSRGLTAGQTAAVASREFVSLRGLRALVVDDVEDARTLAKTVIEAAGGQALVAASTEEALALIVTSPPDVVVADLGMPGSDGYELIRQVRLLPPNGGGRIPLIALTAYGSSADRKKTAAAGFAAHLTKPVRSEELVAELARLAGSTSVP